jgi:N utilization substance protein A
MDVKSFASAIAQIAEEKGISPEKIWETIESAIAAAYKKEYGKKGQVIKCKLDHQSGELQFWQIESVVTKSMIYTEEELEKLKEKKEKNIGEELSLVKTGEDEGKIRFNPEKHIMLEEAKKIKPKIKTGEELEILLEPKGDYGRIAAQTAKQVILQKIREAERESILTEYKAKEGEIISGIVQRIEGRNIFFDIGKTLGMLTREEQVPGEFYRPGQRLKLFLLKVEEGPKGPVIFLSRAYPRLVSKLFELEVPEISADQVEIKSIAREPGSRTKIAVASKVEGIDPIGSAVGQRGTRVQAVINELGGEKIDIIEYSEEPETYIANSLSPAKVVEIKIEPKNKALAVVPEDQLSLAIGKDGQNVRLAAKLTGWKIDVRSPEGAEEEERKAETEKEEKEEKKEKKKTKKKKSKE